MRIDLNAPVPGWFLVLIVALLFATMVGACVADRVRDYRAGRLTDPSRLPSRPRLNNLNDDGCLGLGFFWLMCSLGSEDLHARDRRRRR